LGWTPLMIQWPGRADLDPRFPPIRQDRLSGRTTKRDAQDCDGCLRGRPRGRRLACSPRRSAVACRQGSRRSVGCRVQSSGGNAASGRKRRKRDLRTQRGRRLPKIAKIAKIARARQARNLRASLWSPAGSAGRRRRLGGGHGPAPRHCHGVGPRSTYGGREASGRHQPILDQGQSSARATRLARGELRSSERRTISLAEDLPATVAAVEHVVTGAAHRGPCGAQQTPSVPDRAAARQG
jgi:hypothetical protein